MIPAMLALSVGMAGDVAAAEPRDPFAPAAARPRLETPLERVDIDQIRLVAVVHDGHAARALLEDAGGIGYVVGVGTPVGPRGGVVVAVERSALRIHEPDGDDDIVLPLRTASGEQR